MSKMPVAAWEFPVWASKIWAGASACTVHQDGLQGIPGSAAETQRPPWGGFEDGMGQRRAFGGGCEWVSSLQSKGEGQAGGSPALPSQWGPSRVLSLWGPPGLSVTCPCRFIMGNRAHRWDVANEGMWVEGDCFCQGLSRKQEGRAGGRQPRPLSFGSLLLSRVPRWGARRHGRKNSWIFLLCFCYLFGKVEVKGWSNSNLQLLEGELQGCWNQTLAGSGKQYKQEQWPKTGVGDSNWTIEESSQKIVPYFPSSYHHYSLWHMEMWEKSQYAVLRSFTSGIRRFWGVSLLSNTISKAAAVAVALTPTGNTSPGHRHFAMVPVLLLASVPWCEETCSNLWPGLVGCHWQVRLGHQNFWIALAPLAYCVSLLSHHFYIPHL